MNLEIKNVQHIQKKLFHMDCEQPCTQVEIWINGEQDNGYLFEGTLTAAQCKKQYLRDNDEGYQSDLADQAFASSYQ